MYMYMYVIKHTIFHNGLLIFVIRPAFKHFQTLFYNLEMYMYNSIIVQNIYNNISFSSSSSYYYY